MRPAVHHRDRLANPHDGARDNIAKRVQPLIPHSDEVDETTWYAYGGAVAVELDAQLG